MDSGPKWGEIHFFAFITPEVLNFELPEVKPQVKSKECTPVGDIFAYPDMLSFVRTKMVTTEHVNFRIALLKYQNN